MKSLSLKAYYIIGFISIILLIGLDQVTKFLAVKFLYDGTVIDIIPNVFCLKYLENRGAAFGMLQDQLIFFVIITTVLLVVMPYIYSIIPLEARYNPMRFCAILLYSGAIGNMIDRIRLNYVIDFLYFELIDFPIFNVADIYVTVTCAIFFLLMIFYYKEEELDNIKLWNKKEK